MATPQKTRAGLYMEGTRYYKVGRIPPGGTVTAELIEKSRGNREVASQLAFADETDAVKETFALILREKGLKPSPRMNNFLGIMEEDLVGDAFPELGAEEMTLRVFVLREERKNR